LKRFLFGLGRFFKTAFKPTQTSLLSAALGALSAFSFAPFSIFPLIVIGLSGLFWLWMKSGSATESTRLGLWFGLGLFGVGASWLFSSMYVYSGVLLPLAVLLTFGWVLFLSLSVALSGWLSYYFRGRSSGVLNLVLLFPALIVLGELFRGTIFGGFPFLLSGVTHLHTFLDGYAPWLGVWGVSWAVALTSGLFVWMAFSKKWLISIVALSFVWGLGWALKQVQWVSPVGQPIEVALVQGNIPQELKWKRTEFFPSVKKYISLTKQNWDVDLVVWPETAIPAYYKVVENGMLLQFMKDVSIMDTDVVVGVIDADEGADNYYNALVNLRQPEDRYYKHHLVPFSEYFPFDDAFSFLAGLFDIPYATFSAGDLGQKPLKLGGQDAALSVCFEMAFGEELASQLPEAKYLITVSNDAWFANTFEPAQQLKDVQMRALELGREIARSTNTGYTVVVDTKGRIKHEIPPYEEGVLRGQVQPYDGLTFYAEWKKLPIYTLLALILCFFLYRRYHALSQHD